jgi:hypothetical protein
MISAEDITGTWKLVARGASESQKAQLEERYGTQSEGVVILSPDGWMCAALGRGDRARLPGDPEWHADASDADRLAAFDSYVSYAGRWRIEAGRLITKVEFADAAVIVGEAQDQNFRHEFSDLFGGEIDHGRDLLADQFVQRVMHRQLGGRFALTNFRPEIDVKFVGGVACFGVGFSANDGANANVDF